MENYFLNKKIIITGGFGFLGNHLIKALAARGANIYVITDPSIKYEGDGIRCAERIFLEDIKNREAILKIMEEVGPDIVYHLAAVVSVPFSKDYPLQTADVNFGGTANLLEGARRASISKFIYVSSVEVYESSPHPISENNPIFIDSPYAASKAAAEFLVTSYNRSYGLRTIILRPFNMYGPGNFKNVIFKFMEAAFRGEPLKIEGGDQVKDFLFVGDAVRAFISAGESTISGEIFNIGSGCAVTIRELANKISVMSFPAASVLENNPREIKSKNFICDYRKAEELLAWKPQVSLDEGLKTTCDWVKSNLEKK